MRKRIYRLEVIWSTFTDLNKNKSKKPSLLRRCTLNGQFACRFISAHSANNWACVKRFHPPFLPFFLFLNEAHGITCREHFYLYFWRINLYTILFSKYFRSFFSGITFMNYYSSLSSLWSRRKKATLSSAFLFLWNFRPMLILISTFLFTFGKFNALYVISMRVIQIRHPDFVLHVLI